MKKYQFYGWEQADVPATSKTYEKIKNPKELYDILSEIWCADTCAPRMRERWSKENQTLGQCSITAFLAQDIFGGFSDRAEIIIVIMWWGIVALI